MVQSTIQHKRYNHGCQIISSANRPSLPSSPSLTQVVQWNNVKTTYSCMNNMAAIISSHNAKVLAPVQDKAHSHADAGILINAPSMGIAWPDALSTKPQSQSHISLPSTSLVPPRARSKCASIVTPTYSVRKAAEGKLGPNTSGNSKTTARHTILIGT